MLSTSSTTSSLTTFSTPRGISAGNSFSRESIQRTLHGRLASSGTSARPTCPAPNTAICACGWPMGSNSSTVAPPQHWPRLAPREKRSRRVSRLRFSSISRAICWALSSGGPPPMVSYRRSRLTTIFEPALRGVEPRSSMMVTSTQGSPRCCRSARALIQLICSASRKAWSVRGAASASCSWTDPVWVRVSVGVSGFLARCVLSLLYTCVCSAWVGDNPGGLALRRFYLCSGGRLGGLLQFLHLLHTPEHALRRGRRVDLRLYAVVRQAGHGVLDRTPHGDAKHEGWFTNGLGVEHGVFRVLAVFHQVDAQVQWHVGNGRDLVAGRAVGHQLALAVPHQLFHGQPTHALNEGTFDLTDIDGRIQRCADVMQDVGAQHLVLASQSVDDHLGASGAVGEVVERAAGGLVTVVVDLRRAIETGAGKRYLAEVGLLDHFLEAQEQVAYAHLAVAELHIFRGDLVLAHQEINQTLLECFGSVLCGFAVKVGTAGGGSRRGVWHLVGVGRGDLDARDIHLQHFGDDLRDLGVQTLAHFRTAVVQVNRTVGVDMDQRASLVEEGGGEADAEFNRGQRQAFLQHRALGVKCADFFTALGVVTVGFQLGGHLVDNVVLDGLVVVGDVALGLAVVVGLAHFQRVFAQA